MALKIEDSPNPQSLLSHPLSSQYPPATVLLRFWRSLEWIPGVRVAIVVVETGRCHHVAVWGTAHNVAAAEREREVKETRAGLGWSENELGILDTQPRREEKHETTIDTFDFK
ncbi:hypothetical protein LOK49_LG10G00582 [Camellia lanceoleosa]|uniref:Uncharacterized protein n=1 Tax=Camellia lanceoleosa TaxID=1840588 RepID=A0ACC0G9K9_9ERIC|nr:hypothetical protein LOK49_LG10G00582 [Camellia lanceoleosa]